MSELQQQHHQQPSGEATTSDEQTTSTSSTSELIVYIKKEQNEDFHEPESKKQKLSVKNEDKKFKLEDRLGGILCCVVCLDLPKAGIYQCTNGHLMCAGCFTHLLADSKLRSEAATCPTCRVEISKTSATRNLAVENAVSELSTDCRFCNNQFPRNTIERHEATECDDRLSGCKYSRIGCPWKGPYHERKEHEQECVHPHRSGAEVMDSLKMIDQEMANEKKIYDGIFQLLGFEKILFNDIQLKPYRTDEFVHRLFYESSRFSAFDYQWVIKARINNSHKDPTQSADRVITYQLILKSKITTPMTLNYIVLRGPFGDIKVKPSIYQFEFNEQQNESPYLPLRLPDSNECNRLLAAKVIDIRLIMFLTSK